MILEQMEREFMQKKWEYVCRFVKSKLEYWRQVPKLYYISEGKSGYLSNHILLEDKQYCVDDKNQIYVDCQTGEIINRLGSRRKGDIDKSLDSHLIRRWVMSMGTDLTDIDGEEVCKHYDHEIDRMKYSTVSQVIFPDEWIYKAIENGLELTYKDYCRHFDGGQLEFEISKEKFYDLTQELTAKIATAALM